MADSTTTPAPRVPDCQRRAVLRGAAGLVLAWLTPIRAAAQEPSSPPPAVGDLLVRVDDESLIPLSPDDVPFDGRGLMAYAIGPTDTVAKSGQMNRIILARLNPATLRGVTQERAAGDIVAYSAVCTHAGCDVDEGIGPNEVIYCACHGSSFSARNAGVKLGGPATRDLPALPLKDDGGRLVVAAPFTSTPGYGPF